MDAWTITLNGRRVAGFEMAEGAEVVIGRSREADVVLDNPAVSRRHARLVRDADGVVLTDLGSRNGTFRNGRRIVGPVRVDPGDEIRIGKFVLTGAVQGPGAGPTDLDATVYVGSPAAAPARDGRRLTRVKGSTSLGKVELGSRRVVRVGRARGCDVRVPGWRVGRFHCSLLRSDGGHVLVPRSRWRATLRNGSKVRGPVRLRPGDEIRIGGVTFRYE